MLPTSGAGGGGLACGCSRPPVAASFLPGAGLSRSITFRVKCTGRVSSSLPSYIHEIERETAAAQIGVQLHYWPIPLQPHYRRLGFQSGDFPLAERYANTSFSLPLFPGMTDADQDRVLATLGALLKQQGLA